MPILALKLALTPLLIGGSALAARRWGPAIGGWLIAFPLTSGPVLVFLALDHGKEFAATAAVGSLTGLGGIAVFSMAYAAGAARGAGPGRSLALAGAGFVGGGLLLAPVRSLPLALVASVVVGLILLAARLVRPSGTRHGRVPTPRWDLPARIVVGTTLVVGLTTVAPLLGAGWSGVIATYPVYISVLAGFTHRHAGPIGATDVLAGTLVGLLGTAGFYIVLVVGLAHLHLAGAVLAAIGATLAIQAATMRRAIGTGLEPETIEVPSQV